MVAYSFKARFEAPILARIKCQTIRAEGRRRHARTGEELQLYYGMRTVSCRLLARATCVSAKSVRLMLATDLVRIDGRATHSLMPGLDAFAVRDGFGDWGDLKAFWREEHGSSVSDFEGVLIDWGTSAVAPAAVAS